MNETPDDIVQRLVEQGWAIVPAESPPRALPRAIAQRYTSVPSGLPEFLCRFERFTNRDETCWLLSHADYDGTSNSAFSWDEFEKQSLEAAGDDGHWASEIRSFWDGHLPIMLSVKSGYSCFAIDTSDFSVVVGEAPEYEETTKIADSFVELLVLLAGADERLRRFL